jgi:hypothetical protein
MKNIFKMLAVSTVLVAFSACNTLEQVAPTEETQQIAPTEETQQVTPVEDTQTDTDLAKMYEVGADPMQSGNTSRFRRLGNLTRADFIRGCKATTWVGDPSVVYNVTWHPFYAYNWTCRPIYRGLPIRAYALNINKVCKARYGTGLAYFRDKYSSSISTWYCYTN